MNKFTSDLLTFIKEILKRNPTLLMLKLGVLHFEKLVPWITGIDPSGIYVLKNIVNFDCIFQFQLLETRMKEQTFCKGKIL